MFIPYPCMPCNCILLSVHITVLLSASLALNCNCIALDAFLCGCPIQGHVPNSQARQPMGVNWGLLVSKEKEGSLRVILPLIKQRECSETNWSDIDFCIWMKEKTSEWEIIVKCQRFHSIWPFGIVVVVVIFRPRLTLTVRPLLPQLFNARRPTRIERKFVIRKLKKL